MPTITGADIQAPATVMRAMRSEGDATRAQPEEVPAHCIDVAQHVAEVSGDRDLLDRAGELAALDPEAGRAARVIAGDGVEAHSDELRHQQPARRAGDQILQRSLPGSSHRLLGPAVGTLPAPRTALPVERRPSLRAE